MWPSTTVKGDTVYVEVNVTGNWADTSVVKVLAKISDRFFRYASLCLWNHLPISLRQPHTGAKAVLAIRPGRPAVAYLNLCLAYPNEILPHVHNSCWPTQNLLGLLTG